MPAIPIHVFDPPRGAANLNRLGEERPIVTARTSRKFNRLTAEIPVDLIDRKELHFTDSRPICQGLPLAVRAIVL
jgi:hypothetical protein